MGIAKKTLLIGTVLMAAVSNTTMAKWENRSTEAADLLRYMEDNVGKKMLTGVHASVNYNTYEADWVYSHTGKYPAINCMDFIHDVYSHTGGWIDYGNPSIALSWVNDGGIMAAMWHWGMPTNDGSSYTCTPGTANGETSFRPSAVFNKTSEGYQQMISRIDQVATWMKPLADHNIPIIWRPLHEAQGNWTEQHPNQSWHKAWFWWGIDGPEAFVELWKVMYDRMVNYHGLKNLIWVLNVGDSKKWYPGDEYVDIVAYDCYNQDMNGMRNIYRMMHNDYPGKLCAISEFGNIPYVSALWADGQYWSFLIPWWDNARTSEPGSWAFRSKDHNNANVDYWNNALACDFIITRDELPKLSPYNGNQNEDGSVWKVLYDGGDVPMGNWSGFINSMGPGFFWDAAVGDIVRVYIKDRTGGWQQGAFKNGSTWDGLTKELGVIGLTDADFARGYYEMTLDEATLAQVKSAGLIVSGCNYTATKVILIKNGQSGNGTETGIRHTTIYKNENRYYNLSGQKLSRPQKGLNIINGKKIVIK